MKPRHAAAPRRMMTTAEAAEYLRVHRSTLHKLVRKGQIPSFKIGSDYRFDSEAIEKWTTDPHRKA